jgi:hypothetical protein
MQDVLLTAGCCWGLRIPQGQCRHEGKPRPSHTRHYGGVCRDAGAPHARTGAFLPFQRAPKKTEYSLLKWDLKPLLMPWITKRVRMQTLRDLRMSAVYVRGAGPMMLFLFILCPTDLLIMWALTRLTSSIGGVSLVQQVIRIYGSMISYVERKRALPLGRNFVESLEKGVGLCGKLVLVN